MWGQRGGHKQIARDPQLGLPKTQSCREDLAALSKTPRQLRLMPTAHGPSLAPPGTPGGLLQGSLLQQQQEGQAGVSSGWGGH